MIGDFSDPALVATLTRWLEESDVSELEISTQDGRALKMVLGAGPRPVPVHDGAATPVEARVPQAAGRVIKAPIAGFFRDRHPGGGDSPLAGEGRALEPGAIVGFVEVGPMLLPVIVTEKALISEIHARAGDLVGYGDTILTTEPAR